MLNIYSREHNPQGQQQAVTNVSHHFHNYSPVDLEALMTFKLSFIYCLLVKGRL